MFETASKTCCLISGASRGFGRSVAVALARQFSDSGTKGHFILISRSGDDLEETRNRIVQICPTAEGKLKILETQAILYVSPLETPPFPLGDPPGTPRTTGILRFLLVFPLLFLVG